MVERQYETQCINNERERVSEHTLMLVDNALENIRIMHEEQEFPDKKYYHNRSHTLSVIKRAVRYLDIVSLIKPELISPGLYDCAYIAGAYHDYFQNYQIIQISKGNKIYRQRSRLTWLNEIESVMMAVNQMRRVNQEQMLTVYSPDQLKSVGLAIEITTPDWDCLNSTVYQAKLCPTTPLLSRIIAAADIGTAAIDGPEMAKVEADRLLLEDNIDLAALLLGLHDPNSLSEDEAADIIKQWSQFQIKYLQGRKNRLQTELEGLDPTLIGILTAEFFCHLDESISYMAKVTQERLGMNFSQLAREFVQYL